MIIQTKTEPVCWTCGTTKTWRDCWNCDEDGMMDHDCGEDCCCCLDPVPNVRCDICNGKGGDFICFNCYPSAED